MRCDGDSSNIEYDTNVESHSSARFVDNLSWPSDTLVMLETELNDTSEPNTQDLNLCGQSLLDSVKAHRLDPEAIRPRLSLGEQWRRLYTDAVLVKVLCTLVARYGGEICFTTTRFGCPGEHMPESNQSTTAWEDSIRLLDLSIILAGAPGVGRLDLVHSCIAYIQHNYLASATYDAQSIHIGSSQVLSFDKTLPFTQPIPQTNKPPAFSSFPSLAQRPFVLLGFAIDWPAIKLWKSQKYLIFCSGRGRVVPVERGGDYRREDWSVDIMPWELFLESVGWGEDQTEGTKIESSFITDEKTKDSDMLYLAQHTLFTQFPKIRGDILVPDYVYTSPGAESKAYSGPPGNDEQLVINAWCGGKGANSPAHTDPYFNIYVQVVGYKSVWLAPPEATPGMYAFSRTASSETSNQERDPKREGMLGNTSSVDVFALCAQPAEDRKSSSLLDSQYPLFYSHALPLAQSTTLGPGDALIIPPGWWHAMRGIGGGSFSVSFWF